MTSRSTLIIFALCGLAWGVIVLRAYTNVKGPEDFVVTVSQSEVQDFARAQLTELQPQSFAQNVELCGIIFEDEDGELGTTPVTSGEQASCDIAYFDEPGMAPIASYHTHGSFSRDYDSEVPSMLDLQSDIQSQMDGYVSTPGGRFWRIDWEAQTAIQICGENCVPKDPAYRDCPADQIATRYTLDELRIRSETITTAC